jgi:hypothetical protein
LTTRRSDPDHDAVCASTATHRVIVAPPGTGKTHLAVRLAGSLVHTLPGGPVPNSTTGARVLLLTFSNQARSQLEREADWQLSKSVQQRVVITNYHALFWSAVRAHRRALGLPQHVDVVRMSTRKAAFTTADSVAARELAQQTGLLDAFAEQAFPAFRDDRTPEPIVLDRLLAVVHSEQQAGRLVFDDFGALFWTLLERFPTIDAAYRARFPIVIADEHQDASALQDAVVRRLGTKTLVVLADPMQLIHGYRGARVERLDAHLDHGGIAFELTTPHRWHHYPEAGLWMLAVRERLLGRPTDAPRPPTAALVTTTSQYGFNGVLAATRRAVADAFAAGARRVAVLARRNGHVEQIRAYLARNGLFPRQSTGAADFDAARADIEQLPVYDDIRGMVVHLTDRVANLVPALETATVNQIKRRLLPDGVRTAGCGAKAKPLLDELAALYRHGPSAYFAVLVAALDACADAGHHIPQSHTVRILRATAASATGELADVLEVYARKTVAGAHAVGQDERGLYVMNAHQAKGKEFDAVIVAGASAESFPDTFDGRRLFYVALTRANSRWTFITPEHDLSPLLPTLK